LRPYTNCLIAAFVAFGRGEARLAIQIVFAIFAGGIDRVHQRDQPIDDNLSLVPQFAEFFVKLIGVTPGG
jgi:hypothetical protein